MKRLLTSALLASAASGAVLTTGTHPNLAVAFPPSPSAGIAVPQPGGVWNFIVGDTISREHPEYLNTFENQAGGVSLVYLFDPYNYGSLPIKTPLRMPTDPDYCPTCGTSSPISPVLVYPGGPGVPATQPGGPGPGPVTITPTTPTIPILEPPVSPIGQPQGPGEPTPAPVPEPGTVMLVAAGLGVVIWRRK